MICSEQKEIDYSMRWRLTTSTPSEDDFWDFSSEFIEECDQDINSFLKTKQVLDSFEERTKEYPVVIPLYRDIVDTQIFIRYLLIDFLILWRLFRSAGSAVEKQFVVRKLYGTLNEGFKNLYGGFNTSTYAKSYWHKFEGYQSILPESLKKEYLDLSSTFMAAANNKDWWKNERCADDHYNISALSNLRSRYQKMTPNDLERELSTLHTLLNQVFIFVNKLDKEYEDIIKTCGGKLVKK